jgi:hypothetical protein
MYFRIKSNLNSFCLTGHLEDGLSESLDVAGGDTGNGDTTILGGIDGVLYNISELSFRKQH